MISSEILLRDDVLSQQICSLCQNYLSKGPVKVSKELLITCGECSTREKMRKSAISMYNVVAAASLYKCHNHYNGCKAILNFGANHTECERKTYCCPKCSYKGTGIQLKNHFKSSHIENLYLSNKFTFTSKQSLEEIFLFSTEDYLYALTIENTFIKAINICDHPLLNEVTLHFSNISKLMYCSITCPSELNVPLNELIFVEVHLNRQRELKYYADPLNDAEFYFQCKLATICQKEKELEAIKEENARKKSEMEQLSQRISQTQEVLFLKEMMSLTPYSVFTCHHCSVVLDVEIFTCNGKHLLCGRCMADASTSVCKYKWQSCTSVFDKLKVTCDWPDCINITTINQYALHKQKCEHRLFKCPTRSCDFRGKKAAISSHWHLRYTPLIIRDTLSRPVQTDKLFWLIRNDFQELLMVSILVGESPKGHRVTINVDEQYAVLPINYKIAVYSSNLRKTYLKQKNATKTVTITNYRGKNLNFEVLPIDNK